MMEKAPDKERTQRKELDISGRVMVGMGASAGSLAPEQVPRTSAWHLYRYRVPGTHTPHTAYTAIQSAPTRAQALSSPRSSIHRARTPWSSNSPD